MVYFKFHIKVFGFLVFWKKIWLCSPGCPQTQDAFGLDYWVLGLKAHDIIPGWHLYKQFLVLKYGCLGMHTTLGKHSATKWCIYSGFPQSLGFLFLSYCATGNSEFFLEFWGCQKVCAVKELHTAMPPSVEGRTACRLSSYKPLSQMALFN